VSTSGACYPSLTNGRLRLRPPGSFSTDGIIHSAASARSFVKSRPSRRRYGSAPKGATWKGNAEKRAAIFVGPEFGTVQRADLVAAAREAGDAAFDVLIACAFNYEAHTTEFTKLGRIPVLKARMNADLHMAEDLKNTGKGNLFVIFGEPDIDLITEKTPSSA
jgi:hypothetical protein